MKNYEVFSTTADVGIRIRGRGYAGLFQSALDGFNLLLFDETIDHRTLDRGIPLDAHPFRFHGDSCENILVNFLAEILFLLQTRDKITAGIKVKTASETFLDADLLIIPRDRDPEMDIKSVTYHNLAVREENGVKSAEVVFDI
jgi:SHS2 domain-containing protein